MTRSAVLDLGSNSFHVLVADVVDHTLRATLRSRQMLHLGRIVERSGELDPDAQRNAVGVAAHLAELARRAGAASIIAVATSAIRDAGNGPAVVAELSRATGCTVRVLDGAEEARLAYLGARRSVAIGEEPVVVLDLGGGSLELAVGTGGEVAWSTSTPLGASRISALTTADPLSKRDMRIIDERVDTWINPIVDEIAALRPATVVLVGGTVRALARVLAAQQSAWLPATVNQMPIPVADLAGLSSQLTGADLDARRDFPQMKDRRADHLHLAAHVLVRTLTLLGFDDAMVSDWGLREGVLFDAHGLTEPLLDGELQAAEVDRFRRSLMPDDRHATHVAQLAREIFDATIPLHGMTDADRRLLIHAASLHTIGQALTLRRQQDHGAYLVQHAEMRGFSPTECAMLTTLVRFHPSRGIDSSYAPLAALSPDDADRTGRLLGLLQLADAFDPAHDQSITYLDVSLDLPNRHLKICGQGGKLHLTDAERARRVAFFEDMFSISVELDGSAPAPRSTMARLRHLVAR
ncbi:MAG: Ppx/GppA phosphatase family protein [Nitriliruptoraceae bacterium]